MLNLQGNADAKIVKKLIAAIFILLSLSTTLLAQYDKDVFYMRGRQALSDGKYSQAIENFNILARLDTTDYWNFFFRGIAKYNLGDIRGAQQDFDRSVRLNPVFTNGYHYRAITKSRQAQYEGALADLERAIELRPGNIGLYYSRGVTYFLAQRFDEAVEDFDRYIKKEPRDNGAYLNRGAAWLFLRDTTKALDDYNKAIRLDRFEPEGFMRRGRVYAARGEYDLAIKDLNQALQIDSSNTLAYFNRALIYYDTHDYNLAMADLNRVLEEEPGNALTLYNRSLIRAQVGDFENALDDIDRVININPGNVLAYFNRASYFIEMGRWQDALADYNKAIELYPDFAKAYMNRAYVESMLGLNRASREDYNTARRKVAEYRSKTGNGADFADTTRKYSSLLAFDAEFAKKDFDNELLQHRDVDIRLKPLYKFRLALDEEDRNVALSRRFENPLLERFRAAVPVPVTVSNSDSLLALRFTRSLESVLSGDSARGAGNSALTHSQVSFLKGIYEVQNKQYSTALQYFDEAVRQAGSDVEKDRYSLFYKAFYLMNRAVLRAEMIDFIASIENVGVQTLTMDDQGATRARVSDQVNRSYDYSEAIGDLAEAIRILPDIPYLYFNLGNLYCLSSQMVSAIENYGQAIKLYPYMGDAYYNRGLVLIYLKDKEKGCIDLSRAGELGVPEAYSVISKYCEDE